MFQVTIESEFCAAHALVIAGARERVHGHNWAVTVTLTGPELDPDGLLVDFHAAHRELERILAPFRDGDLNATPPFDRLNPTAENVARHIADALASALALPPRVRVESVRVTESTGCAAVYRRPESSFSRHQSP